MPRLENMMNVISASQRSEKPTSSLVKCYFIERPSFGCNYKLVICHSTLACSCGRANLRADVSNSGEIFCSAGTYCPTTTKRIPCNTGTGSTSEKARYHELGTLLAEGLCFSLHDVNGVQLV